MAKTYLGNVRVVWTNGVFPEAPKQEAPKAAPVSTPAAAPEDDLPF